MPGYTVNPFVDGFIETPAGPVPRLRTCLNFRDLLGTLRARVGIARNQYKVNPGLYCIGNAGPQSPVLVTANYKLSFDSLRKELAGIDAWILVADTRGINVWCAAGKGTFSADEVALQVMRAQLDKIVSHRRLILPQLAAPGLASQELNNKCGFRGVFGPLRAADIPRFLHNGIKADEDMRTMSFTFKERLVLVPVEIALIWKVFAILVLAFFFISGIGPEVFTFHAAWARGIHATEATVIAILAGALVTPLFLPWIPGRQFWLKGVQVGALSGLALVWYLSSDTGTIERISLLLWTMAAASYMAMNFTGATPYTSLSGVEKEMRRGLPVQFLGIVAALGLWIAAPFIG